MPPTLDIKLACPECRRENERERIYCHDCGAKLDRSALAKAKPKEEDPAVTQRRLKAMLDPHRANMRRRFFLSSKVILAAFAVAGIAQMVRSPDLPPRSTAPLAELPDPINMDLENAAMDPRVGALRYSDEQINAFLAYALKSKQSALSKYIKFERALLAFDEGVCRVTVERSLYGQPLCTSATYAVSLQNGQILLKCKGGQIGRLPVHPAIMQYGDVLFADLRTALERERKVVVKLGTIELHPKLVVFAPKQPQT
jgi:hypothetical protein